MLSSIFREEILKWNIKTVQNESFDENLGISPGVSVKHKQECCKFDISNTTSEIFRNDDIKYNNEVIECF